MGWQILARKKPQLIILAISIFCLVTGAVLFFFMPRYINSRLTSNLIVKNESAYFSSWSEPSIPSYLNIYFFNVTNPEQALNGQKPLLDEIGPYSYMIKHKKIVQEWNDDERIVSYLDIKNFYYISDDLRSEDDLITTINFHSLGQNKNASVLITKTIRELTFLKNDSSSLATEDYIPNMRTHLETVYGNNGSKEEFSIYTGNKGINKYTYILSYQGKTKLKPGSFDGCNQIKGTDGKQFPFPVTSKSHLYVFSPSLCQSIRLKFQKWVLIEQMNALRFVMPEKDLGLCSDGNSLHSLNACGTNAVVSIPYFLREDKHRKDVNGLKSPIPQRHSSFFDIEPTTGLTVRSCNRMMVSFFITFNQASPSLVPCFWAEQNFTVSRQYIEKLQSTLLGVLELIGDIPKFIGGFGFVLLITAVVLGIRKVEKTSFISKNGPQTNTINNTYNFEFPVNPELY